MKLRPFYQIPFERNSSLFEYSLFCPQKNFHSASMILKRHLISFIKEEREERNYIIDICICRIECNQTYFKSILLEVSLICTVKYCICLIYFKVYLEHKLLKLNICKYQKFEQFSTSQHPRPYTSSRTSCSFSLPSPPPFLPGQFTGRRWFKGFGKFHFKFKHKTQMEHSNIWDCIAKLY